MRGLPRDRRGVVALWTGLAMPVLLMAAGAGVEVGYWSLVRLELQRAADLAALAGGLRYGATGDAAGALGAAADAAELNGAAGGTRGWNDAAQTLSGGRITAQLLARGVADPAVPAVKVTVGRDVPTWFTRVLQPQASVTVSATAWAEVKNPPGNAQPCVLGLKPSGDAVIIQGNSTLTLLDCSLRSNAGLSILGSPAVTAAGVFAGGAVSIGGAASVTGPIRPMAGELPDPYKENVRLQSALNSLSPDGGRVFSDNPQNNTDLQPGVYKSLDVKGTVALAPGLYFVNGDVSFGAQASVSGTGVTIVSYGAIKMNGGATLRLSAPGKGAAAGVPGVVLASKSSAASKLLGNSAPVLTGVVYAPNASLDFGGTADTGSRNACLELIALTIKLQGNATLGSSCKDLGATPFASLPVPAVTLVQ